MMVAVRRDYSMPVSPQDFDAWVTGSAGKLGYQLVGMGVKRDKKNSWNIAYLFKHRRGGTVEFPAYYIWEVPSIPGKLNEVSAAAEEAAKRQKVQYYGKLPKGSNKGDSPPWIGNPVKEADPKSSVSLLTECADGAFRNCCYRSKEDVF